MKRREMLGASALAAAGLLSRPKTARAAGGRIYAFIPSDEKARTIEQKLQAALSSLDLTAFGRAKDLSRAIQQTPPDAVLAPTPTLRDLGLSPTLQGQRGGSTTEPYVLVTVDAAVSPRSMSSHPVGVLGIMGHQAMKRHCGHLLGTGEQKVKTVTKYADLLPLLQFQAAKGVVLPRRFAASLTSRSALRLVVNDIPNGRVGIVGVAVTNSSAKGQVVGAMKSLSGSALKTLGVEVLK